MPIAVHHLPSAIYKLQFHPWTADPTRSQPDTDPYNIKLPRLPVEQLGRKFFALVQDVCCTSNVLRRIPIPGLGATA